MPLGKIRVFVFNDNAWANGAPDTEEGRPAAASRSGWRSRPTARSPSTTTTTRCCGGTGRPVPHRRRRLRPARRPRPGDVLHRRAPAGPARATATRTAAGTRRPRSTAACSCRPASRRAATAPAHRASSCGSRRTTAPRTGSASSARRSRSPPPGTGEITGQARNWQGWPPFDHWHLRRAGREPVRRAVRLHHRPRRSTSARATRRQLRHPERARRRLQPRDLGRAAQLHHPVHAGHVAAGETGRRQRRPASTARSAWACRAGSAGSTARLQGPNGNRQ